MIDDFSAIEDYLISQSTPGLRVWCHADGVAAQFGRLVFTFSPLCSAQQRGEKTHTLLFGVAHSSFRDANNAKCRATR